MGTYDTIGGTPISPPDEEVCEFLEGGKCTATSFEVMRCDYKAEDGRCTAWWTGEDDMF